MQKIKIEKQVPEQDEPLQTGAQQQQFSQGTNDQNLLHQQFFSEQKNDFINDNKPQTPTELNKNSLTSQPNNLKPPQRTNLDNKTYLCQPQVLQYQRPATFIQQNNLLQTKIQDASQSSKNYLQNNFQNRVINNQSQFAQVVLPEKEQREIPQCIYQMVCAHSEHQQKQIGAFCKRSNCELNSLCCRLCELLHANHKDDVLDIQDYIKWKEENIKRMKVLKTEYEELEEQIRKTKKRLNKLIIEENQSITSLTRKQLQQQIADIKRLSDFLQLNDQYKKEFKNFTDTLLIIREEILIEPIKPNTKIPQQQTQFDNIPQIKEIKNNEVGEKSNPPFQQYQSIRQDRPDRPEQIIMGLKNPKIMDQQLNKQFYPIVPENNDQIQCCLIADLFQQNNKTIKNKIIQTLGLSSQKIKEKINKNCKWGAVTYGGNYSAFTAFGDASSVEIQLKKLELRLTTESPENLQSALYVALEQTWTKNSN